MTGSVSANEVPQTTENIRFAVFVLSSYEDGKRAAETMQTGSGMVINGENLDNPTYQRVVDFLDGAAHVLAGQSIFLSDTVQAYIPTNMEIIDEVGSYYGNLSTGKKRFDG
jgi:FtsZ-interacting cell division protein YlmF